VRWLISLLYLMGLRISEVVSNPMGGFFRRRDRDGQDRLPRASAHWLRHTTGSHMMDGRVDLRYVRDNLGHGSISTTSQYLDADDDDRHRATEAGLRLDW
jgi:site-specific recombinase XerD